MIKTRKIGPNLLLSGVFCLVVTFVMVVLLNYTTFLGTLEENRIFNIIGFTVLMVGVLSLITGGLVLLVEFKYDTEKEIACMRSRRSCHQVNSFEKWEKPKKTGIVIFIIGAVGMLLQAMLYETMILIPKIIFVMSWICILGGAFLALVSRQKLIEVFSKMTPDEVYSIKDQELLEKILRNSRNFEACCVAIEKIDKEVLDQIAKGVVNDWTGKMIVAAQERKTFCDSALKRPVVCVGTYKDLLKTVEKLQLALMNKGVQANQMHELLNMSLLLVCKKCGHYTGGNGVSFLATMTELSRVSFTGNRGGLERVQDGRCANKSCDSRVGMLYWCPDCDEQMTRNLYDNAGVVLEPNLHDKRREYWKDFPF